MDLHVILTIGEYAFRRIMTGWFIKLLGVAAVLVVGLLFMGGPDPQQDMLDHKSLALDLIGLAGLVLVCIMGATEIPRDVETQTILILLSKPITKDDVVLGKFVGLVYVGCFTVIALSLVCMIACLLQGWMSPEITKGYIPDLNLLQKVVFRVFQTVVVSAIVILLSTRLSEIPIIALTAFYALLGFFSFYLRAIIGLDLMNRQDAGTLAYLAFNGVLYAIYYAIPNLKYLQIPPETPHDPVSWSHFLLALLYSVLYACILLVLALRSFRGREVAG